MSTIEKLFIQIFDRKKGIIDQVKHQIDLFDQRLASKLIIDGILPPPWLHSSFLHHSHTYDFKEVNPNLVSNEALVVDDSEELQHRLNVEDSSLRNDFDAGIRLSVLPQCRLNEAASNLDMSPISPQGRGDVVLENYQDPNLSLARLQRSKSRQKALEFRNSVKSARFESRCENKDESVACGIMGSAISSLQSNHRDELEMVKPSNNNTRDDTVEPEDDFCCEQKDISDKITTSGSPGLQRSPMLADNSPYVSSKDERLRSIGSLNPGSDNVNEQLDLSKPFSGNIECCEEAELRYYRRQENNFDDAEQSGLQRNSLGVSNSSYISSEDERLCPIGSSKLYSDNAQLNLFKPSSGNECFEESKLGHRRSDEFNVDNVKQSGFQHSSMDVDYPSCFSSEDRSLCPIGSLKQHSDQVGKELDLSKPSSGNIEFCEGVGIGCCRSQDFNFDKAEQLAPNKISSPIMEIRDESSYRKPSPFVDEKEAVYGKEKCNPSSDTSLPQMHVDLVKEGESHKGVSEAHSEERCEVRGSIEENAITPADKSLQDYENAAACSLPRSDEPSKQNISFEDQTSNFQFANGSLVKTKLVETDNAPVLIRVVDSVGDLTVMSPSGPSSVERAGNLKRQLTNSGISQFQGSDSFEDCSSDCKDNYHCIDTEGKIAENLTEFIAFRSDLKASGSHNKQREVEVHLDNGTPAFLGSRDDKFQILDNSIVDQNSMHEDNNQKPLHEYQQSSFHEGHIGPSPSVSKSPTEVMPLEKEMHSMEGSEFSCRLPVKEVDEWFESNKIDRTKESVTLESQMLDLKENLHLVDNEPIIDTGKAQEEKENGKFTFGSLVTPHIQTLHYRDADEDKPALEGFLMQADYERPCLSIGGMNFEKFDLSKSMIERASILEKLCKSACINSPLTSSLESFKLNKVPNLYHSLPNGLLEGMDLDLKSNLPMNDLNYVFKDGGSFLSGEVNPSPHGRSFSDCLQSYSIQLTCDIRKPFASPFGKFSDRISSSSSCSGKSGSLNVELPCISEENENADEIGEKFVKDTVSELITNSVKRVPLAEMTENSNLQVTVSEAASDRFGLESLNTEFSNTGTNKENHGNERSSKRRYLNKAENQNISPGANRVERVTRSSYNRFSRSDLSCKDNFKKEGLRVSEKECKHKNIVSNLTSFIPLVQQREAATILKGKRDIKVKAIEAAEVAKRHAEKKENERQMKKEALKLERARMEQENLRQLELEKKKKEEERKKKEEERKKKEADMAAKKRQREDEERKEKQRKRMRVEEVRKRQRGNGGKLRYDKEKEVKLQANDQNPRDKKGGKDETEKRVKGSESDNFDKLSVSESIIASTCGAERASFVMETQVPKNVMVNRVSEISEESYQISPYKGSDDEDEEDDDDDHKLNNKFVPSWARKDCLALLFASQLKVNPEFIFPPESFCDIAEVLLPRKHQSKIK